MSGFVHASLVAFSNIHWNSQEKKNRWIQIAGVIATNLTNWNPFRYGSRFWAQTAK